MGKRKKKKRGTSGHGPARSGSAESGKLAEPTRTQATVQAPSERRQRKEEVRRRKERELRRLQLIRGVRRVAVWTAAIAVVGGGVTALVLLRTKETREIDRLLAAAPRAAETAGCTEVQTVPPYGNEDSQHVPDLPPVATYPSVPPASGPHFDNWESAGIKDEPPELGRAIHALEHAGVIIWYAPKVADTAELKKIESFVNSNGEKVILAPYNYPDEGKEGTLPENKSMALVAWHHLQLCNDPSLPVVAKFLSEYRNPPLGGGDYKGDAPEPNASV